MGCLNSKPQEDASGGKTATPMKVFAPTSAAVAQHHRQAAIASESAERPQEDAPATSGSQPALVQDWSERPEHLKANILHSRPSDKRMESHVASLADLAKKSFQKRTYFGEDLNLIAALLSSLRDGPPPVAKASAHALKLLSFCHPNHETFIQSTELVPVLIGSLQHQEYKVTVYSLSALCNLSASPRCVQRYAADERLLASLERILTQNVQDGDPQAHAAQLVLNLTRAVVTGATTCADDMTAVTSTTNTQQTNTQALSQDAHSVQTALTLRSTRESDSQQTTHKPLGVMTASTSEAQSEDIVLRFPRHDVSLLLATALRVLTKAAALEQEARENCIEAILAMLQRPDSGDHPDLQASAIFLKNRGLSIIMKESLREGVLASTQMLVCQILHLFARTHIEELFEDKLVHVIGHMLAHKTKRGADERQLDVDVQHAALMLVLRVHGLGRPRQQQDLAHETVHRLSPCLCAASIAVQLSACRVIYRFANSSNTRHALHVREIARRLVELNEKQHPLSTAPAIQCIGLLCELSSENADAVVRANGLHAMLCTLEDDCPAQAQRHALVSICKVLQRANTQVLSPELQNGRTISLTASVLHHTAHSGVNDQQQWLSWCCRVLHDAALVAPECATKVVSVLSKKPEVLKLIDVDSQHCAHDVVLRALKAGEDNCSSVFLAKVADLQQVEEAVACELVRGHHPLLTSRASKSEMNKFHKSPSSRPQLIPACARAHQRPSGGSTSGTTGAGGDAALHHTADTFASNRTAKGSAVPTLEITDASVPVANVVAEADLNRTHGSTSGQFHRTTQDSAQQRVTDPSPLQNTCTSHRSTAQGGAVLGGAAHRCGAGAGLRMTEDDTAMQHQHTEVDRGRGAGDSSPDCGDDKDVEPHQLHAPRSKQGSSQGGGSRRKRPEAMLKKGDDTLADSILKPTGGKPDPLALTSCRLNIKHMIHDIS